MKSVKSRGTYHHGDLPAALIAATFELIEENGVHGFSVAEAARRTGVSISAPYRHFADRDELLAACATAGLDKSRYPGLEEAAGAVLAAVAGPALALAPSGDEEAAGVLVQALTGLAQGHATLLLEGGFGELPQAVDLASERAAAASRALIRGRSLLLSLPGTGRSARTGG